MSYQVNKYCQLKFIFDDYGLKFFGKCYSKSLEVLFRMSLEKKLIFEVQNER